MEDQGNEVYISTNLEEDLPWLENAEKTVYRVLSLRDLKDWEVSLHFCGDEEIRELNSRYRGKDQPTDVLSFSQDQGIPFPGGKYLAGDIIISVETVKRNAMEDQIPFETELKRLLIHGVLHLEGMDHLEEDKSMLLLQEKILEQLLEEEN